MKMSREMLEGKDYPTQWALNPSTYQNMSNDQVDWAALAQQWIKMKETVVPPAPPPRSMNINDTCNDGGGEAPMDMDTKDDDVPPAPPAPNISGSDSWNQWSQWGQWNTSGPGGGSWEWSGVPPPGVTMGPDGKPTGLPSIPPVPPAPTISNSPSFNVPPPSAATPPYSYSTVAPVPPYNQVSGYWGGDQGNATASQPPPFMKGIRPNRIIGHMGRGIDNAMRNRDDARDKTPEEDTCTIIDAAKRRQLPAWIRQGLEKMEREKHKAVERERQEILRKQEMEARKLVEDEARALLNPSKSKFDSDSEKEPEPEVEPPIHANEDIIETSLERNSPEIVVRARKSRFRDADSPDSRSFNTDGGGNSSVSSMPLANLPPKRSREEILHDVMLKVRNSLTEILMEVTNEEIGNVCREVWSRSRAKAPAGETPVASFANAAPLAQITRKLGLGIYGDSNSESEDEAADVVEQEQNDSDEELKETLKRRQQAFKKTEEEIEARLAQEEEDEDDREEEEDEDEDNRNEDHHHPHHHHHHHHHHPPPPPPPAPPQHHHHHHTNKQQYENHIGNDSCRSTVDEKETINNEREASSESRSSVGYGSHSSRRQQINRKVAQVAPTKSPSTSEHTVSSERESNNTASTKSTSSSSSSTDDEDEDENPETRSTSSESSNHSRTTQAKNKSKNKNKTKRTEKETDERRSKKSGSVCRESVSRDATMRDERRKKKRSDSSSSYRSSGNRSKRRERDSSRSVSRRRTRSRSRSKRWSKVDSRERSKRRSRSRSSHTRDRRRSRSRSRERRRSRSYVSRSSKRRSRTRSRENAGSRGGGSRRLSRSKSRQSSHHRDGKKSSSHRYRD